MARCGRDKAAWLWGSALVVSSSLQPSHGHSSTVSTWIMCGLIGSWHVTSISGLPLSQIDPLKVRALLLCSVFFISCRDGIVGGMQNSGMLSGVMMLGQREILLTLSPFSPNIMSAILKLNSADGIGRFDLSTDTRIFSTTHMCPLVELRKLCKIKRICV